MHISRRLYIVFLLLVLVLPLSGTHMGASLMQKYETKELLEEALHAAGSTRSHTGLFAEKNAAQQELEQAEIAVEDALQHKDQARRKFTALKEQVEEFESTYGIDVTNTGAILATIEEERSHVVSFIQYLKQRSFLMAATGPDFGLTLARNLLHVSLGEMTDIGLRHRALQRASFRVFSVSLRAKKLSEDLTELEDHYEQELKAYEEAWELYLQKKEELQTATDRIAQVQRITNEVQANITNLQRELARIDAKLVAKLERELIEKGLMSAQPGERSDGRIRSKQAFRWPAVGRISAGFYNAAYKTFFGVAHKGIDIVVPQGSRISSASDGVVYLVRDGGRFGYSYVLIGHRNGYATLYGHLSSISVKNGQEIAAGQVVGYSGGTPGTYGAGPMTTGAHLHFEVIKGGVHVDPLTVLP